MKIFLRDKGNTFGELAADGTIPVSSLKYFAGTRGRRSPKEEPELCRVCLTQ